MVKTHFFSKGKEKLLKKSVSIFIVFLILFSGLFSSTSILQIQAAEGIAFEEPNVSKDIEGEGSKEVHKGEDVQYNVNVEFPQNVEGYETVMVTDQIDTRLTVQEVSLLIDNQKLEEQSTDGFQIAVGEQEIVLNLYQEQIEELAGKEIILNITAQVRKEATAGESIESNAQVIVNNSMGLHTNSVLFTPVDVETTEEKVKARDKKEKVEESKEEDIETEEDVERTKEDPAKTEERIQITDGITINNTDTYLIASGYILQLDGNDLSIEKGRVELDRSAISNSLALGKNEDVFYANAGSRLYKIYPNGETEFETDLEGSSPAGAITPDGNEYVYLVTTSEGELLLGFYDLVTGDHRSIPIQDNTGFADLSGGDFAFDGDGNLWFSRWQDSPPNSILAKVDTQTGVLESVIPIISNTDNTFSRAGAMSFLPNGKLFILGNYTPGVSGGGYLLELDPATGIALEVRSNDFGLGIQDAASRVYPVINPEVEIEKSVSPTDVVSPGDELSYTLKIQNRGDLASTLTTVRDELPRGTTYVSNSTTLNGQAVEDNSDGVSPLFSGMYVNSPNESLEGVLYVGEENAATVTFKVRVNDSLPIGEEISNVAFVSSDGEEDIPSNEVITNVGYKDPVLESEKSATLFEKMEGNFDEDHIEVGDTIRYTITTQNTVVDSLVENLVITDTIPEGLTYVEGSLEVDGESVTDAEDTDAGDVVDGVVTGKFGNIADMDKHTVTFLVTVDEGQAGKDIKNVASVGGDNTTIDEPEEEVQIYPREPNIESEKTAENLDKDKEKFEVGDTVVYTIKARNTTSDSLVENLTISDDLPKGLEFVQDSIEVSHEGNGEFNNGLITVNFGDIEDTDWRIVTFEVKIQSDQHGEVIKNIANVAGDNVTDQKPEAEFTVELKDPATSPEPEEPKEQKPNQKDSEVTETTTSDKGIGKELPKTATNMFNYILAGILLVLAGVGLVVIRRIKTPSN